jgi:hypothetical protein
MSNLYWGPSIDDSYQVSVHLAEGFQRRRLKCEKLADDGCQVMARWANKNDFEMLPRCQSKVLLSTYFPPLLPFDFNIYSDGILCFTQFLWNRQRWKCIILSHSQPITNVFLQNLSKKPWSGQIKDYKIGICCFSARSIKEKEERLLGSESA